MSTTLLILHYCVSLLGISLYHVVLRRATQYYVVLRNTTCYYVLLRTTPYYYVLHCTTFYYVLLRITPAAAAGREAEAREGRRVFWLKILISYLLLCFSLKSFDLQWCHL